jgi:hypothetical protein
MMKLVAAGAGSSMTEKEVMQAGRPPDQSDLLGLRGIRALFDH